MPRDTEGLAKRTAISYFGLSSATDAFPKGLTVSVVPPAQVQPDEFLTNLDRRIASVWVDNVGSLSKTGRLSLHDFAHYVNEVRGKAGQGPLSPGDPKVERWMAAVAALHPGTLLVEVSGKGVRKLLLVNTEVKA